jgi:hypothetical protein
MTAWKAPTMIIIIEPNTTQPTQPVGSGGGASPRRFGGASGAVVISS